MAEELNPGPSTFLPEAEQLSAEDEAALLEEYLLTLPDEEGIVITEGDPPPFAKSWGFDWEMRRFQMSSAGHGPLEVRGEQTLRHWVGKLVNTARGAHPVHPPGYGVERPFSMIGQPVEEALTDNYEARLREALIYHPRIADMRDFDVETDSDEEYVVVSFTVVLDDGTSVRFVDLVVTP